MDVAEIEKRVLAGERPKLTDAVIARRQTDPVTAVSPSWFLTELS